MERKLVALSNIQQAELRQWRTGGPTLILREDARIQDGVLIEAQCITLDEHEVKILLALLGAKL